FLIVDQNRGVLVKTDDGAIGTANVGCGANHHSLHYLALLNAATRNSVLDRNDNNVADRGVLAMRTAQHLDAHDSLGAGVIGDIEIGLHLDHNWMPSS